MLVSKTSHYQERYYGLSTSRDLFQTLCNIDIKIVTHQLRVVDGAGVMVWWWYQRRGHNQDDNAPWRRPPRAPQCRPVSPRRTTLLRTVLTRGTFHQQRAGCCHLTSHGLIVIITLGPPEAGRKGEGTRNWDLKFLWKGLTQCRQWQQNISSWQ